MSRLAVLSAGAARGVVTAIAAEHGFELEAQFGAVGAMQELLEAGAPCDLIVLTRPQIEALQAAGRVTASASLGSVRTGIAVPAGAQVPEVGTPEALKQALLSAAAVYFPDPRKATAGIHFAKVLQALQVGETPGRRFHAFPNGAAAMRELAAAGARAIGCTQITEILYTPGVSLAGALPDAYALTTVYAAGVCRATASARRFFDLLTGEASSALRAGAGFELRERVS